MADRNRELVPDNWSLVRERADQGLCWQRKPACGVDVTKVARGEHSARDPDSKHWFTTSFCRKARLGVCEGTLPES